MKSIDFGINPKDTRPQLACGNCGLIDATVKIRGDYWKKALCNDCLEVLSKTELEIR